MKMRRTASRLLIGVGGRLVEVPDVYLSKESEYTDKELQVFYTADEGSLKEAARAAVLSKRLEFHKSFCYSEGTRV
jgi:hypothetical protein